MNRLDPVSSSTLKKAFGQFRSGRAAYSLSCFTLAIQKAQQGQVITQQYWERLQEEPAAS